MRQSKLKYLLQKDLIKILSSPPPVTNLDIKIRSLFDPSSLTISVNFGANSLMFVSIHPMLSPVVSAKPLTKADAKLLLFFLKTTLYLLFWFRRFKISAVPSTELSSTITISKLGIFFSNSAIVFSIYFASLYVHNIIEVLEGIIFYLIQFLNHYPSWWILFCLNLFYFYN